MKNEFNLIFNNMRNLKAAVNQDAEHSKTGAKFHWAEKVKL